MFPAAGISASSRFGKAGPSDEARYGDAHSYDRGDHEASDYERGERKYGSEPEPLIPSDVGKHGPIVTPEARATVRPAAPSPVGQHMYSVFGQATVRAFMM